MEGPCSSLSQYLNSSQCTSNTGGAEVVLFTSLLSTLINANLQLGNPNDYPPDASSNLLDEYDFIVIGGGSAGCVVANRLSEVKHWNVLLIEAGGNPTPTSDVPGLVLSLQNTEVDWQHRTFPDNNACLGFKNQECIWNSGKILGGSSTTNGMLYIRGNKHDYDRWEQMGNTGWDYDGVLPYFKKSEGNRDNEFIEENADGTIYHSGDGLLSVELFNTYPLEENLFQAINEIGYDVVEDVNGPNQLGFTHLQGTLINATRCNTAKAFLTPIKNRKNLHVSKFSEVMKINIDPESKKAYSVKFKTAQGQIWDIRVKKEVIVSGGTVKSPQILMLSGIGPKEHLQNVGIDVIQELQVGKNLQDHIGFPGSIFSLNKGSITGPTPDTLNDDMYQYLTNRSGPLLILSISFTGFIRTSYSEDERPDLQIHIFYIPSSGRSGIQTFVDFFGFTDDTTMSLQEMLEEKDILFIMPTLLLPKSAGEILLNSADPFDKPVIQSGYLSEEIDIKVLLEGINFTTKFLNTNAMKNVGITREKLFMQGCENFDFDSEIYWTCMLKHIATTFHHPVGSCKMGPSSDPNAVVDSELKVHGVKGVRVIDASIMPKIVCGNTNAPTIMIAEKGSDFIKEYWKGNSFSSPNSRPKKGW